MLKDSISSPLNRFAVFTAAALKMGVSANHASASINFRDLATTVYSTESGSSDLDDVFAIDVNQDGIDDISISHNYKAESVDAKMGFTFPAQVSVSYRGLNGNFMVSEDDTNSTFRLDGGEVIYPEAATQNWIATGLAATQPENSGSGSGVFYSETVDQSGFLAFRLMDGTDKRMGWLELTVRSEDDSQGLAIDVGRVAYETIPNQPIEIGSTTSIAVPEPANFSLIAAGAASVALFRRRAVRARS